MRLLTALIAVGGAAASTLACQQTALVPEVETGTVAFNISWRGELPTPLGPFIIDAKFASGCCPDGEPIDATNRSLRVGPDGGIADTVITLTPEAGDVEVVAEDGPYVMEARRCRFEPHILVVPAGGTIRYLNSDPVCHNFHTVSRLNATFNNTVHHQDCSNGQARGGLMGFMEMEVAKAEVISLVTDLRPWMAANIFITKAPFFGVTDAGGGLRIEGVQPGAYRARWWHETLGKGELGQVEVVAGGVVRLERSIEPVPRKTRGRSRR